MKQESQGPWIPGPAHTASESEGLGWEMRFFFSNTFPVVAKAASSGTTL